MAFIESWQFLKPAFMEPEGLSIYYRGPKMLSILNQFSSHPTNNIMKLMNNMTKEKK
jgi:hypothetical protein